MGMSEVCKPEIKGFSKITIPTWSFLIEHSSITPSSSTPSEAKPTTSILFDLGFRKDHWNNTPSMVELVRKNGWKVEVQKDPVDILLEENNIKPEDVDAIIWSHYHLDHTGDPCRFPKTTKLIVGDGFREKFPRGWPSVADSPVREDAWEGRELVEISFDRSPRKEDEVDESMHEGKREVPKIGRFKAVDYFGDGSFYLLQTPGHAVGHICGLARTTEDTFIFMGGDAAHHTGEFRPSKYLPLPESVSLDPAPYSGNFDPPPEAELPSPCPRERLLHIHRTHDPTDSFFEANPAFNADPETAQWTVDGVAEFDAADNIFVALAHDTELKDVIDTYPSSANDWRDKGWDKKARWRFLGRFADALADETE